MAHSAASKRDKCKGFTLIEIMIVLIIISAILAIAVPSFVKARSRSQSRVCISNLRHIQDAKERWAMDHRKTNEASVEKSELVTQYLKKWPSCPGGGDYEIGKIGENPTCTVDEHKID